MSTLSKQMLVFFLVLTFFNSTHGAVGPLSPYPENRFYWQDGSTGKPIMLIGGSDYDSIFQWLHSDLIAHLDLLQASGGNYIRLTLNSRTWDPINGYQNNNYPQAFAKTRNGIYDLSKFNPVYWNKLKTFFDETKKRNIVVQFEFWDTGTIIEAAAWSGSPWNPKNNINYTALNTHLRTTNGNEFLNSIPSLNNDVIILDFQKKYINKALSVTLKYDHILYQIDNETFMPPVVSTYWAIYAHSQATKSIYIAESRRYHPPTYSLTNFQLASEAENANAINNPRIFNYLDISQNSGNFGQTHYDNQIWYRNQVLKSDIRPINHTKIYKFTWRTGTRFSSRIEASDAEGTAKLWRTVFAGAASVRFHRFNTLTPKPGIGLTSLGQKHIKSMRMFLNKINLFAMAPDNNVLSSRSTNEAYALVNSGQQYAVYFTGEGNRSVKLNLSAVAGAFKLQWLNINDNSWLASTKTKGGSWLTLQTPGKGQWVVVLAKTASKI